MTPAFASWNEFFAMGGYAFFVWLAVVMTVIPSVKSWKTARGPCVFTTNHLFAGFGRAG